MIGCGFFAANQMNAWRSFPDAEIVALCDLNRAKAERMGAAFGVRAIYDDARIMFEREKIDFVDIITTAPSHRRLVELAAGWCRLVICQKPLSETLEDADAMVNACSQRRVALLVHENFRWQRPFREIAARVRAGCIGSVVSCRLTFRHAYDIYEAQPYLAQVERLALMDVGTHLFDLSRALVGNVSSVQCSTERANPKVRGEDVFLAHLKHVNGVVSVVDCSFFDHSGTDLFPQTLVRLDGTDGSLQLKEGYRLVEAHGGSVDERLIEPEVPEWGAKPWHCIQDSVINIQHHALDVLEGRTEPQPSGAHNRDTLALVLAAYESAAGNEPVQLRRQGAST